MPIYEYQCPNCIKFEQFQSITAEPLTTCPICGASVKRLISFNPNIIFKGSGFHITDYRSSDYQKKSKEESSSSSPKESKVS